MAILDKFSLQGRTALVTGCSRGIGQALAVGIAEAGASIIGVSQSLPPDGGETGRLVEAARGKFFPYQCDFSDRSELEKFIEAVRSRHQVDVLVNNAGTIRRAPAAEHSDEDWDRVIRVNLDAQFILTRELGRDMLERGRGKIIFISSLLAFQGGITVPGYAASKGAVGQLVKAFANEWAPRNVCVNAIAPGYIATDNTAALRKDPVRSVDILKRIPAARWGEPEDLVGAAVFLASAASDYVHGATVLVDGGWMSR